jgi:hypothetical protein
MMNETEFWKLIAEIDTEALDQGDEEAAVWPLQQALSGKSEEELFAFEEILAQKLYALDGAIYAKNAGESGSSDDSFLYARLYVVAKGKSYHETVFSQPQNMPKSMDQWCESLLYTHREAWAEMTGQDASEWPFFPSVSYESGSNNELWPQ